MTWREIYAVVESFANINDFPKYSVSFVDELAYKRKKCIKIQNLLHQEMEQL